jgi:hypothetical protein
MADGKKSKPMTVQLRSAWRDANFWRRKCNENINTVVHVGIDTQTDVDALTAVDKSVQTDAHMRRAATQTDTNSAESATQANTRSVSTQTDEAPTLARYHRPTIWKRLFKRT